MIDVAARLQEALAGRYHLERELGWGGMATVYLARDLRHHRHVALKVLRTRADAAVAGVRFLQEIETTAQLTHPHILPLLDSGEVTVPAAHDAPPLWLLYYVMPYVEGESLRAWLDREGRLAIEDAVRVACDVSDALDYAHAHGVVHRDIKPENILIEAGHAVVADFGVARALGALGPDRLTQGGITVGTPRYMSPEQAGGAAGLDGRSDIYSLGCVLYEMLAGAPPFSETSRQASRSRRATVPSVSTLREAVPAHVDWALATALAPDPADRFGRASRFAEALRGSATGGPMSASRAASRWAGRLVGACIVIVALGILGWLARTFVGPPAATTGASPRPATIVAELGGNASEAVRAAARNLVIAALDESDVVAPLPDDQLREGLARAGRPPTTRLDVATARELAVRGAVRTVVTGTVDQVGRTFHAAVVVLEADSGAVVATERGVARGEDDLIPVLDRIVRAVRADLGERRAAIAANRRLEEGATPSFQAYQHFREARDLHGVGDYPASEAAYKRAIAIDSRFAMAWRGLAALYSNIGQRDSALLAVDQALAHPDRLSEGQRYEVEGLRARVLRDYPASLAAQQRAQQLNRGIPWMLADALVSVGRVAEAVALVEAAERSAPFGLKNIQHATVTIWLLPLGRFAEARRRAAMSSGEWRVWAEMQTADWTADWSAADSLGIRLMQLDPAFRDEILQARGAAAAARGRVREALGVLDGCSCQLDRLVLRVASGLGLDAPPRERLSPSRARRTNALDLAQDRLENAMWAAEAGDSAQVDASLTAVAALPARQRLGMDPLSALAEAWRERARGHPAEVVRLLRPLAERGVPDGPSVTQPVRWLLADAYARTGKPDSAVLQLELLASWSGAWENDRGHRGLTHAFAHQRLVALYAGLGRPDDARRHWQALRATLSAPDPEVRALLDGARAVVEGVPGTTR